MSAVPPPTRVGAFADRVAAWPLFAGIVAGFALSVGAGHRASHLPLFGPEFQRFHAAISPAQMFYPPLRPVVAMARERIPREQVAVIVAGNSTFRGHGQAAGEIWSQHLERELGPRYRLLNLSLDSAYPSEGPGFVVAETFLREGRPVVFLANALRSSITEPFGRRGKPDFTAPGWNAWHGGDLLPSPARDTRVGKLLAETEHPDEPPDFHARMHLNRVVRFDECWHWVAYHRASTVWAPLTRGAPWRARRHWPDAGLSIPWPGLEKLAPGTVEQTLKTLRIFLQQQDAPMRAYVRECAAWSFATELRPHTLMLVSGYNPAIVEQLTSEEVKRYASLMNACVEAWHAEGFHAAREGDDFLAQDFSDNVHYSPAGARKIACILAPQVRAIARAQYPALDLP